MNRPRMHTPMAPAPPSSLSLGLLPLPPPPAQRPPPPDPIDHVALARVPLADIAPFDGASGGAYVRAVEALSGSLMRHNAAIIEVGSEGAVLMRCALESARMYFKAKAQCGGGVAGGGKSGRGVYTYRAGRALEDGDFSPPCMSDAFRCLGKASRAALSAIARHLRLRNDVFNNLLDDTPLPANEVSSSVLVAAYSNTSLQNGKGPVGAKTSAEVEKGLLTLISSDCPGIQVCDANSHWYLADRSSNPGDLLLLTGRALSHVTCGLRPAASYRTASDYYVGITTGGRASLTFRLMPQGNAMLDSSPITAAGHVIPQSFQAVSVSQFMDDLSAEEDITYNQLDVAYETPNNTIREPSLRSVLSDPLSGAFLEDAMVVSCGHSFGGYMLRKVIETPRPVNQPALNCNSAPKTQLPRFVLYGPVRLLLSLLLAHEKLRKQSCDTSLHKGRCTLCHEDIDPVLLIPNLALRAAATAVKTEDDRRLFHNASLRKRRKEVGEQLDALNRSGKENGEIGADGNSLRPAKGVQYPFTVNEKVQIKGNRRTPDKFVGREAVITSQCLNGWYLLKILDSGERVRLQYRSLKKLTSSQSDDKGEPLSLHQGGD